MNIGQPLTSFRFTVEPDEAKLIVEWLDKTFVYPEDRSNWHNTVSYTRDQRFDGAEWNPSWVALNNTYIIVVLHSINDEDESVREPSFTGFHHYEFSIWFRDNSHAAMFKARFG